MPFYGIDNQSASTRPVRRATLPYVPSGGSSNSGQYQPRSAPERFSANDVGGVDVVGEGIAAAARAPGYIYERPLALIDTLTGGNKATGQKGAVEQGIDTLKSWPIVGDLVRGAGNVLEGSAKLHQSLLNSIPANILKDTAHQSASEVLNPVQAAALGTNYVGMTIGDFRKSMFDRGFSQQDINGSGQRQEGHLRLR